MPILQKPQKVIKKKIRKNEYIVPSIIIPDMFWGFFPDNKRILVSNESRNNLSIYDIQSKKINNMVLNNNVKKNPDLRMAGTVLSPDGKSVMIDYGKAIKIYDTTTCNEKTVINEKNKFLCFSSDSKNIATFNSGYVYIISVSDGKEIKRFKPKNSKSLKQVYHVSEYIKISPDFTHIGTILDDGSVLITTISSGKEIIIKQQQQIEVFCFSSDSKMIATVQDNYNINDNIIPIFEIETGKEIQRIEVNYDILIFNGDTDKYNVRNICFSNDSKSIASYSNDGFARIFNLDTAEEIFKSAYLGDSDGENPRASNYEICFSPNNNMIAFGTYIFDLTKSIRIARKFPVNIGFSFYSETEDLNISKLSTKEKELIKETALLNINNLNKYPLPGERPNINLKNCKFIFDKYGLIITAFTNYNPSSTKMRHWMRWDLYWFNDRGTRKYPNNKYSIEINGNNIVLGGISLTPFVVK
jgi:WD40 repeat protein